MPRQLHELDATYPCPDPPVALRSPRVGSQHKRRVFPGSFSKSPHIFNLSSPSSSNSMAAEPAIDLLRRFVPAICRDEVSGTAGGRGGTGADGDAEAIELSLDLSLGGERREKKLLRSSTVASVGLTMFPDEELRGVGRTCSLPTEVEEEVRKRKEIQGMKRMEAKRRRLEKKESRSGSGSGSQGSASSVLSDLESLPSQGSNSKEVKSPSPVLGQANHKATTVVAGKCVKASSEADDPSTKAMAARDQDMEKKMLESMPCVSTRGDGPNGKRIHGFLYKYGKCEEVRILCVCHGIFLTPAEFVKHAGGGDVANPLRHIVVSSPSPSALL